MPLQIKAPQKMLKPHRLMRFLQRTLESGTLKELTKAKPMDFSWTISTIKRTIEKG